MANILQATYQKTFWFELRIYMILYDYFPLIQWNKSPLVGVMVRQAIVWTNDGQTHIYASCQWVNWWGMYETSLESQTKWSALVGLCELHFVDNLFNQPTNQISGDLWKRGAWSPFLTSNSLGAWFECPRCSLPWVPGHHFCVNRLRPRQDGCHFPDDNIEMHFLEFYKFRLRFHWSLFPIVQITIFHHRFRWWVGADQVTSHCLNQGW